MRPPFLTRRAHVPSRSSLPQKSAPRVISSSDLQPTFFLRRINWDADDATPDVVAVPVPALAPAPKPTPASPKKPASTAKPVSKPVRLFPCHHSSTVLSPCRPPRLLLRRTPPRIPPTKSTKSARPAQSGLVSLSLRTLRLNLHNPVQRRARPHRRPVKKRLPSRPSRPMCVLTPCALALSLKLVAGS